MRITELVFYSRSAVAEADAKAMAARGWTVASLTIGPSYGSGPTIGVVYEKFELPRPSERHTGDDLQSKLYDDHFGNNLKED